jgi:hypothetical protein
MHFPTVNTFLDNSFRISMMYLLKKIMFPSYYSSFFSLLNKLFDVYNMLDANDLNNCEVFAVNFFIYCNRYMFWSNFYLKVVWNVIPYSTRLYAILIFKLILIYLYNDL